MCSIVGYIGSHEGVAHIFQALRRLEYRGYDSAGCAAVTGHSVSVQKAVGGVDALLDAWRANQFDGTTCIGHTRWATHGKATRENAHPHCDNKNTVAIVHNGIIDNEQDVRQFLQQAGYTFCSQTDSELIAHLIAFYLETKKSAKQALLSAADQLSGSFAICAITAAEPEVLLLARQGSPLCIGVGDTVTMVASDVVGCSVVADTVVHMPHNSCAVVTQHSIDMCDTAVLLYRGIILRLIIIGWMWARLGMIITC